MRIRGLIFITGALSILAGPALADVANEPPKALNSRGLANLEAFAALYGDVRFFHPSDQAANADWDALAIAGVERVEGAQNASALSQALLDIFEPVGPLLRIYPAKSKSPAAIPDLGRCAGAVIEWRHRGVKLTSAKSVYSDERVPTLSHQIEITRIPLAGKVEALVPVTLCRNSEGSTIPTTSMLPVLANKPVGFKPSGNDRTTRLADVVILWSVLKQFYPYFDVTPVDWNAELVTALKAAATDRDDVAFSDTLARLIAALRDGHGNIYHVKRRILPLTWELIEGRLIITALLPGGAGLRRGDEVTAIDGQQVHGLIEKVGTTASGATPQWRRFKTLQLTSETTADETSAKIEGTHADGHSFSETVPTIAGADYKTEPAPPRPNPIDTLKPGLMYVDLSRLTKDQLNARLGELVAARAVIFDVRDYPTGDAYDLLPHLSDHDLHSARFEIPIRTRPNQIGVTYDASGSWDIPPSAPKIGGKLLMLVGPGTISYAESLAGVFEGEHLGIVVGEPTAGTNGNIDPLTLPGGYSALFTGTRVRKLDGSPHHGVGILPQIYVHPTVAGIRGGRDEVLDRAIKEAMKP